MLPNTFLKTMQHFFEFFDNSKFKRTAFIWNSKHIVSKDFCLKWMHNFCIKIFETTSCLVSFFIYICSCSLGTFLYLHLKTSSSPYLPNKMLLLNVAWDVANWVGCLLQHINQSLTFSFRARWPFLVPGLEVRAVRLQLWVMIAVRVSPHAEQMRAAAGETVNAPTETWDGK